MMLTILAFIIVLGITITVHEFGHFAMAKLLKIRVLVFSIGFGPRLVGVTRGGTEYRISPIPIGGYVKMAGEAFDEERKGAPDEFLSHSKWHRFLVAIAGPAMNIALAVALVTASYIEGIRVPRYLKEPAIVGPIAANSIARRAGLQSGDRILSVRGTRVGTWEEMEIALATAPRDALEILVQRGSQELQLRMGPPPSGPVTPQAVGLKFRLPRTVVAVVSPNSPAQAAGLKAGDEILSVEGNGRRAEGYDEILTLISESTGIPLMFEVRRSKGSGSTGQAAAGPPGEDAELHRLRITPAEEDGRGLIGFIPDVPMDLEKYGVLGALRESLQRNLQMAALTFKIIGRIFTGSASVKTISGPLEIARISGDAARTGSVRVFLSFLALITLQLGVFNLLPIPILDGGVIALLAVEALIRRDLSMALKERIVQVGFVFLILLMGFVVVNDLSKIVPLDRFFR
ncbi:MAG: RIP metalloprotease RseP [Acidobacteria bacterium]|nr:RIP metalloprotease RseP [Acidobacteriota bacterium]